MSGWRRYLLGHDLHVLALSGDGTEVEGTCRLRPGQLVDLAGGHEGTTTRPRLARVESWAVVRVGREGLVYRGVCRWMDSNG